MSIKKSFCILLAVVLLFPLGVLASAENGPCPTPFFTYLAFSPVDENGQTLTEIVDGWEQTVMIPLYANNEVSALEGAVYDKETNTLTLTDFNHPDYLLRARMMGDDLKLCVKGVCSLAGISISGEEWGGSLTIIGDGSLVVNGNKTVDSGLFIMGAYAEKVSLTIGEDVSLTVNGKKTAVEVYGYNGDFSITKGEEQVALVKEKATRTVQKTYPGFTDKMQETLFLATCADDPDGIYDMRQWSNDDESWYTVKRYIYIEKYDLYVEDIVWTDAHKGDHPYEVRFASEEDVNKAGIIQKRGDSNEIEWIDVNVLVNHFDKEIYQDTNGNKYCKGHNYDNGERVEIALQANAIDEVPGEYIFLYAPDVDPATLTAIYEDVEYDDIFDYHFPETVFVSAPAPDFKLGDVNNDGEIGADDARLALRRSVDLEAYAEGSREFLACDVNHDASVGADDARSILRASVSLDDPASWEKA